MGGDDLGSDDENWMKAVPGSPADRRGDDDDNNSLQDVESSDKKRKAEAEEPKKEKKKSRATPEQVLLETGRRVEELDPDGQAKFLSTALANFYLLKHNEKITSDVFLPEHIFASKKENVVDRLKDVFTVNQLKKWKFVKSPCVIFVCLSARRAVELLKELAPLKIRASKLFPKNGSVSNQRKELASTPFAFAVGTPNRLHVLASAQQEGGKNDGDAPLSLKHTQLIVFDTHVNNKQFTVCTLPDTAPDCMRLLKEHVAGQLKRRKDIKLAFF